MRRTGFTLIELLVVIAIIAILAAILFPVFERAKNKAQQAACISNLKQMVLGVLMYAHDYDTMLPNWSRSSVGWPYSPCNVPMQPGDLCHYSWGGTSGWLYKYTQSEEMFQCPAAEIPTIGLIAGTTQQKYYTYMANSVYESTRASAWAGYDYGGNTFPGKTLDYFQYPTHFVIFFDGQSYLFTNPELRGTVWYTIAASGGPLGTLYPNSTDPTAEPGIWGNSGGTDIGGLKARHNGIANCAFLDGHAKGLTPAELWDAAGNRCKPYYFDASGTGGQATP